MVTFAISGHRRGLRFAVHAAALAAWAAAALLLVQAPLPVVVLWIAAGVALGWNAVRRGAGRETLTVTPSSLVLCRRIGPFRMSRRFDLAHLTHVHAIREPGLASHRHRVEFTWHGHARRFGRNLTGPEASTIVDLIRRSAGV
jgi:hypothetical protein